MTKNHLRMQSINWILRFVICAATIAPAAAHAGQKVNLLLSGEVSNDYVRGVDSGSQLGYGAGLSLSIPGVASGLFRKSSGSGGAKGVLNIDLDFGLEVGIFYAQEHVNFNSNALTVKVVRVPAILWLQINKNVWFGGGAHLTQNQQPLPGGFGNQYLGFLAALRFNIAESSSTGFAIEGRYLHGLQNIALAPESAQVDGVEGVLSIRFGSI